MGTATFSHLFSGDQVFSFNKLNMSVHYAVSIGLYMGKNKSAPCLTDGNVQKYQKY